MLTSDGRAYFVRWGHSATSPKSTSQSTRISEAESLEEGLTIDKVETPEGEAKEEIIFDEKIEMEIVDEQDSESQWEWTGICFHRFTEEGEELGSEGVRLSLNKRMDLLAVGSQK